MNSSQKLWGEDPPNEAKQKQATNFMKANFPDCVSAVKESLICAQEHHNCKSDPCKMINERLQYCMVFSYCPKEAEDYAYCFKHFKKPVTMSTHPRGCTQQFRDMDACMSKNTI